MWRFGGPTFAYFKMTDLEGGRTWWNCEMWRVRIISTLLHIISTMRYKTSTMLHKTSTLHTHSFITSTFRHIKSTFLHIIYTFSVLKCGGSTLHPHFQFWNMEGPHYIHIFVVDFSRNFRSKCNLITLSKHVVHSIKVHWLDPITIFRKRPIFSFRFSENGNILSVSFSRKHFTSLERKTL